MYSLSSRIEYEATFTHKLGKSTLDIFETGVLFWKKYRVVATWEPNEYTSPQNTSYTDDAKSFHTFDEAYEWGWAWITEKAMND